MPGWLTYSAHEQFVAPARSAPQVWRLLLGLAVAAVVYLVLNQMLFRTLYRTLGDDGGTALFTALQTGATPLAMYILLLSFGFMIMGAGVAARIVHRRPALSLLGPPRLALRQFRSVIWMMFVVGAVIWLLPPWDMGAPLQPNMPLGRWLMLLPLSLVAVLVQVSAEEIFFRGYVQQQLAARFKSPLMWMVLPAVLFGLGHYLPGSAGANAGLIALWAAFFGILMADLTARAGTLGPAIAVHFINNISAILIVSMPDDLSGLALYLSPFSMDDTEALRAWLPVDFALMLVSWLAARLAIRR